MPTASTPSRGTRRLRWTAGVLGLLAVWSLARDDGDRVTTEDEALARVIKSEIGVGTRMQKLHVAWSVRNLAREQHTSIAEMVCSPCGPQMRGRPVSSRQRASEAERKLARLVLDAPAERDPTGGATHFLNPQLQDALAQRGTRRGYRDSSYRKVRKRWMQSYGWRPYYRLGQNLEFWGPKKPRSRKRR